MIPWPLLLSSTSQDRKIAAPVANGRSQRRPGVRSTGVDPLLDCSNTISAAERARDLPLVWTLEVLLEVGTTSVPALQCPCPLIIIASRAPTRRRGARPDWQTPSQDSRGDSANANCLLAPFVPRPPAINGPTARPQATAVEISKFQY